MLKNNKTVFKMSPPFADCEEANALDNHLLKETSGRQQFDSTTDLSVVKQIIAQDAITGYDLIPENSASGN
jgi:hypothetical protein